MQCDSMDKAPAVVALNVIASPRKSTPLPPTPLAVNKAAAAVLCRGEVGLPGRLQYGLLPLLSTCRRLPVLPDGLMAIVEASAELESSSQPVGCESV